MLSAAFLLFSQGEAAPEKESLTVFMAAALSPAVNELRKEAGESQGLDLRPEASGSQVACRKITELGRRCDLLMLADNFLFKELASSQCSWRIDFALDEMVLGVGIRAKRVDDAEKDWLSVVRDKQVRLACADENLNPVGYRALMVWQLQDPSGRLGSELKAKAVANVEDVSHLATLLKTGNADYAFLYRSTCVSNDIRYIALDKKINLGAEGEDYGKAQVRIVAGKVNPKEVLLKGSPITMSLSVPSIAQNRDAAIKFITWLLCDKKDILVKNGLSPMKPKFYGTEPDYAPFKGLAERAGDF